MLASHFCQCDMFEKSLAKLFEGCKERPADQFNRKQGLVPASLHTVHAADKVRTEQKYQPCQTLVFYQCNLRFRV